MSDPYTDNPGMNPDPDMNPDPMEEPGSPEESEMPGLADSMLDPDVENPTGVGEGDVEADTASGGAPEP